MPRRVLKHKEGVLKHKDLEKLMEVRIVLNPREIYFEKFVVIELRGLRAEMEAVAQAIEECLKKKMEVRRWEM